MAYSLLRPLLLKPALTRLGSITGTACIPATGSFIIAPNHVTYIEPAVVSSIIVQHRNTKVYAVTKYSVWHTFHLLGIAGWLGMVSVDRDQPDRCLQICADRLRAGSPVLIFPEGTRNTGPELLRGKTGAARLALWTGLPVLPVGYRGPGGHTTLEALQSILFQPKEIHVQFGEPLQFAKTDPSGITHDLLEQTTTAIMRAIAHVSGKPYPY